MTIIDNVKTFINKLNAAGIPLPMLRVNGKASFTATMTFIAFNTALLGQIGKVTHLLGNIDLTQANYLFLICLGAYLGRGFQKSDTGAISMDAAKTEDK